MKLRLSTEDDEVGILFVSEPVENLRVMQGETYEA